MTERTAAEIRQRERATRDFESDENAVDLADLQWFKERPRNWLEVMQKDQLRCDNFRHGQWDV